MGNAHLQLPESEQKGNTVTDVPTNTFFWVAGESSDIP